MRDLELERVVFILDSLPPLPRWRALWIFRCVALRACFDRRDWRGAWRLVTSTPGALIRGLILAIKCA